MSTQPQMPPVNVNFHAPPPPPDQSGYGAPPQGDPGQMPPEIAQALGMGGGMQPGMGAPPIPPDAAQQAVWGMFPSTDPDHLAQLAQQAGSVEALLPELLALIGQDDDKLKAMQRQQLDAILHLLAAPQGPAQPPGPPLGVGGQSG